MTAIYSLYAAIALVALLVSLIYVSELRWRWVVAVAYPLTLGLVFVLLFVSVGKPRPFDWDAGEKKGSLVHMHPIEDVGIYLLIQWEDEVVPMYYSLPWNLNRAKDVRQALQRSEHRGIPALVKRLIDDSLYVSEPPIMPNPPKETR